MIYIPVGVALFVLRTILALLLYFTTFILPNVPIFHSIVYKLTYIVLGIIINVENIDKKEEVDAFISNKVTHFDSVVINSLAKCVTVRYLTILELNCKDSMLSAWCTAEYFFNISVWDPILQIDNYQY